MKKLFIWGLVLAITVLLLPTSLYAQDTTHLVINEVFVNPNGIDTDKEWIELYNPTAESITLAGWIIESAGTTFQATATIPNNNTLIISPKQYILIGEPSVANTDFTTSLDFQNGGAATDGIRIKNAEQQVIDTILYDTPNTNSLPGDTTTQQPISQPKEGYSLARTINGNDTNNAEDFKQEEFPTPKQPNPEPQQPTPTSTPQPTPTPLPQPTTTPAPKPIPEPTPITAPTQPNNTILTIKEARSKKQKSTVTIQGIVTASPTTLFNNAFYIQDKTAGIKIYSSKETLPELKQGDIVTVTGTLSQSAEEAKINIAKQEDITKHHTEEPLVPKNITENINFEEHEGQLLQLYGIVARKYAKSFELTLKDQSILISIKDSTKISTENITKEEELSITGILIQDNEKYKLLPRNQEDIKKGTVKGAISRNQDKNTTITATESTSQATQLPKTGITLIVAFLLSLILTIAAFQITRKFAILQKRNHS